MNEDCTLKEKVRNNIVVKDKIQELFNCTACGSQQSLGLIVSTVFDENSKMEVCFSCAITLMGYEFEEEIKELIRLEFKDSDNDEGDKADENCDESINSELNDMLSGASINWESGNYRDKLNRMIEIEEADEEEFGGDSSIKSLSRQATEFLRKIADNSYSSYDEESILEYLSWNGNPVECIDKCRNLALLEKGGLIKSEIFRSIYGQAKYKALTQKQLEAVLNANMMKLAGAGKSSSRNSDDESSGNGGNSSFDETEMLLSSVLELVNKGMEIVDNDYNTLSLNIMRTVLKNRKGMSSKQLASIYFFMDRNKDVIYGYVKSNSLSEDIIKKLRVFLDQYSKIIRGGR